IHTRARNVTYTPFGVVANDGQAAPSVHPAKARRIAATIAKLLSCSAARFSSRDLIGGRRGWRLRGIFSARSLPRVFAIGLAGRIIGADSLNNLLPRVVQCVAE